MARSRSRSSGGVAPWLLAFGAGGALYWLARGAHSAPLGSEELPHPNPTAPRPARTATRRPAAPGPLPEFLAFDSEPEWVRDGSTLVQRLYRDQGTALNFYLQAMLYSAGSSDDMPTGVWSGEWSAAYADAASVVSGPLPAIHGSTAETIAVVSAFSNYRLVPMTLPQPLIDAINAMARRYYSRARLLQMYGEAV